MNSLRTLSLFLLLMCFVSRFMGFCLLEGTKGLNTRISEKAVSLPWPRNHLKLCQLLHYPFYLWNYQTESLQKVPEELAPLKHWSTPLSKGSCGVPGLFMPQGWKATPAAGEVMFNRKRFTTHTLHRDFFGHPIISECQGIA